MSFIISATLLLVVVATPGYPLPSTGTPAPTQYFSCYYDWCEVPWEFCDKEDRRCNPCSLDVCRRQNFPQNCTQACHKLLSPKTTTTTTTQEPQQPQQPQQVQESPQLIEKWLTTLTALVIAVLIVVVIGFSAIGAIIFHMWRKRSSRSRNRDLDSELPEERKPLQATESGNISQSSDSSSPPAYTTTYPGPTPLDNGEPPIFGTIASETKQPATNAQSSSYSGSGGPAPAYLTSSGQNSGQVQSPAHRAGGASLPAPNAASFDINSPRMTGNSFPLTTPTLQGVSKHQHQKDLIEEDMDIPNNFNQSLLTEDATPDNDNTAPKSNTFGARPLDV